MTFFETAIIDTVLVLLWTTIIAFIVMEINAFRKLNKNDGSNEQLSFKSVFQVVLLSPFLIVMISFTFSATATAAVSQFINNDEENSTYETVLVAVCTDSGVSTDIDDKIPNLLPRKNYDNLEFYLFERDPNKESIYIAETILYTLGLHISRDSSNLDSIEDHSNFVAFSNVLGDTHGALWNYYKTQYYRIDDERWLDALLNIIILQALEANNILAYSENLRQISIRYIEAGDAAERLGRFNESHLYFSLAYRYAVKAIFASVYENNISNVSAIIQTNIVGDIRGVGAYTRIRSYYYIMNDHEFEQIDRLISAFSLVATEIHFRGF
jgi:uncharacterized protein YbaR (Trm112 family)